MVSKEQFLEIKRCRARGMKAAEIASKVGISAPSVRKWWDIEEKTFDERIKGNIAYLDNYREFILNILRLCPQTRETNIYYRLQEEFPDFHCHKKLLQVHENAAREDRLCAVQPPQYVSAGGIAAWLRRASGFRSILNEGYVWQDGASVFLLHGTGI